jgi:hypothetical protein
LRDFHAARVKISRGFGQRKNSLRAFGAFSAKNPVGIGSAK